MSRFCMNCGAELPEGAAFCIACGTPAGKQGPPPQQRQEPYRPPEALEPPPYDPGLGQDSYAGRPEEPQKKKSGCLTRAVVIVVMIVLALRVLGGGLELVGDIVDGIRSNSSDEIMTLEYGLPTVNPHTPEGGGYILSFGKLFYGVPMDYKVGKNGDSRSVLHPDTPKKIDQLTAVYDDAFRAGQEKEYLELYKDKFSKVTAVAYKNMGDYKLYYIVGKMKVQNKSCDASCVLILEESDLYAVTFASNIKKSRIGMAADYLAFDPDRG